MGLKDRIKIYFTGTTEELLEHYSSLDNESKRDSLHGYIQAASVLSPFYLGPVFAVISSKYDGMEAFSVTLIGLSIYGSLCYDALDRDIGSESYCGIIGKIRELYRNNKK